MARTNHTAAFAMTCLFLLLALSGCMGGEAPFEDALPSDPEAAEAPRRTVIHDLGQTVIEGTPKRVVALEWIFIEDLLSLGLQPVGVADKEGYERWVGTEIPLSDDVEDVGTRQEPSLERIAALQPDLILAIKFRHEKIHPRLSEIAPTLVYEAFPSGSTFTQFTKMEQILKGVAKAVAREDKGTEVLEGLHAHLAAAKDRLEDAQMGGREVLVTQVFTYQGAPVLRVFTDRSIAIEAAERTGLVNAWTQEGEQYGYSTVSMEALAPVQHADYFYVAQPDDDPVEERWSDNPVWMSYTFVREDRVFGLEHDTWLFPGPLGVKVLTDRMVDALIAWKEA